MKKINYFIVLILSIITCSCRVDKPDCHYHIPFTNNSYHAVYVDYDAKYWYTLLPHFRDTILHSYYLDPSLSPDWYKTNPGEENNAVMNQDTPWERTFEYELDTLLVFVFNADTLETRGWDYVRENYKVEQRYDLILEDLQRIGFRLSFPPDSTMKHIHMWPPYGTYDEHGHRKDKEQIIP